MGLLSLFRKETSVPRSIISEPINVVTGGLGSGKTLFAISQADALKQHGDADVVYQVGIREPDTRHLPNLPFPLEEWHTRADAGELKNAVIIVDEFHTRMPQRGPGRAPEWIEAMAETRARDVRWILITQSKEFDHFVKGRVNRHFYLSRKLGIRASTIYEWMNRFVGNPEEDKEARAAAMVHPKWRHPVKRYGHWYKSAAAHRFRVRIPLRLWLVPIFIVVAGYLVWKAWHSFGGLLGGESLSSIAGGPTAALAAGAKSAEQATMPSPQASGAALKPTTDLVEYLMQFRPLDPTRPWSAPVFQGAAIVAKPELYCVSAGAGEDANGEFVDESCRCFTEQGTPYVIDAADPTYCKKIARGGVYNPYRTPPAPVAATPAGAPGETHGKALEEPRAADGAPTLGSVIHGPQITGYGDLGATLKSGVSQ